MLLLKIQRMKQAAVNYSLNSAHPTLSTINLMRYTLFVSFSLCLCIRSLPVMNVMNFFLLGTPSALDSIIFSACKVDYTNCLRDHFYWL